MINEMRSGTAVERSTQLIAGAFLLAAAAIYLVAEGVTAAAYSPGYSFTTNYISDLGVPVCGSIFDGRPICSPLHVVMNAGFIATAVCFLAAAITCADALSSRWRFVFVALALAYAAGDGLIATFPETNAASTGSPNLHVLGAALAILGGNAAILSTAPMSRQLGLPPFNRYASVVLPILGLLALQMLVLARGEGSQHVLPEGTWERMSVYAITGWQILTGASLLMAARPR